MNNNMPRVDPSFWQGLFWGSLISIIIWSIVILTWSNT